MKTSNKIITYVSGLIVITMITGLIILRKDVQSFISTEAVVTYSPIKVDKFHSLDFSDNWNVTIRQGNNYVVELQNFKDPSISPNINVQNGTAYFQADSVLMDRNKTIHVRITAPKLETIRAINGSEISMRYFATDSLNLILEDGCLFRGKENAIEFFDIKTSGESVLELTDNPNL